MVYLVRRVLWSLGTVVLVGLMLPFFKPRGANLWEICSQIWEASRDV